jgi:Na+(H+)/acetate symporter ActP
MTNKANVPQIKRGLIVGSIMFGLLGLLNLGLYVRQFLAGEDPFGAWVVGAAFGLGATAGLIYLLLNVGDRLPARRQVIMAILGFLITTIVLVVCLSTIRP